jgi:hypothetical protein
MGITNPETVWVKPEEEQLLRQLIFPEEDRHLYTTEPWSAGFRWFRSTDVICIEKYRGKKGFGRGPRPPPTSQRSARSVSKNIRISEKSV